MDRGSVKGKILVVDDSPPILDIVRNALEDEGYTIYVAVSGEKAISRALQLIPDLIVLDVLMPGMDGFETCRLLKADEKTRDIPVIFMTGLTDTAHKIRGFEVGGVDYVTKPIEIGELIARVAMHLSIHGMQEELRTQNERLQQEIVERTRAEGKILTLNTELEQRVEERTAELKEEIEERKQAEEALRESEEQFHQLFEQNEDALMLFTEGTSKIIDVNPAAVDLYGYSKEILITNGPLILFESDDFQILEQALLTLEKNKFFTIENIPSHGINGKNVNAAIRGQVIRLQHQNVVFCLVLDITEKLRMKKEAAIMQSKLIFANKMSSLGVLVSSVAHEINNPNNFILFNSSLISDAWRDAIRILDEYQSEKGEFYLAGLTYTEMREAVGKLLEGVMGGSQRIKAIVNNLKDFAKQDTVGLGGMVNINKVITVSVAMLNNQIKKHTRNFHVEYGRDIPEIRGSSQQLEQVVVNLLMNALEALPSMDAGILVTTSWNASGNEIIVDIRDEGTGIPEKILNKIAEPFFTTKNETGGTGLGLPISYSIIRDHGGFLQLQPGQGKGTQTIIRLPVSGDKKEGDM